MAIEMARKDLTPAELRAAAGITNSAAAARRMLPSAQVLEGIDRETAARSCGMERQTLRDRVHRDNAEGLAGLRQSPFLRQTAAAFAGAEGGAGRAGGERSRPGG